MDANLRNFKDFLQIYNLLSQSCFKRCIDNLNSRTLEDHEVQCVEDCSEKFIKLNHRFMALYMNYQQALVSRRVQEAEKLAQISAEETGVATNTSQEDVTGSLPSNGELLIKPAEVVVQ